MPYPLNHPHLYCSDSMNYGSSLKLVQSFNVNYELSSILLGWAAYRCLSAIDLFMKLVWMAQAISVLYQTVYSLTESECNAGSLSSDTWAVWAKYWDCDFVDSNS